MKKILSLFLGITLCFTGCRGTETSIGESEYLPSQNQETSVVQSIEQIASSSEILSSVDAAFHDISSTSTPEPEYFPFQCETVSEFIQWTKRGGAVEIGLNGGKDNPRSSRYLNWSKQASHLVVPKVKNEKLYLRWIQVGETFDGYYMQCPVENEYYKSFSHNKFNICFYALSKSQEANIDTVTEELVITEFMPSINGFQVNHGTCAWGNFCSIDAKGTEVPSMAWFVYSSFLIVIQAYQGEYTYRNNQTVAWDNDYFDYFDFEKVSLR